MEEKNGAVPRAVNLYHRFLHLQGGVTKPAAPKCESYRSPLRAYGGEEKTNGPEALVGLTSGTDQWEWDQWPQ